MSRPTLPGDDRAVSEVLGAILMFGLLIAVLVLIQVNAVPAENQQVEFEHNQRVQQDMIALDTAILQAATEDVPTSTQVELSARYPSRFFLINPGVGAGVIETMDEGTITISNAAAPSASNYWDGTDRSFDTPLIRYRPNYNEYRNAPETVYEHSMLVNSFESGANVPVDSRSFIDGDQVTLLLIDGQLSTASTGAVAVETTPLSGPARTITVKNQTDSGIELSVPTTLTAAEWNEILQDEPNVDSVQVVLDADEADSDPYNTLTVTLAPGSYELRMGRVGVGTPSDGSDLGPYYVTGVDEAFSQTVRSGETKDVTVQISDRYNNPAEGEVTFTSPNGAFRQADGTYAGTLTKASDEDGRVTALFKPYSGFEGSTEIVARQDFDNSGTFENREQTTFDFTVKSDEAFNTNNTDAVSGINPWFGDTVRLEDIDRLNPNGVTLTLYNNGTVDRRIEEIRLLFFVSNNVQTQTPDSATVNGEAADTFYRLGDWETVDQDVIIPSKGSAQVNIMFTDSNTQDFFGLAVQYNGTSANYFVQIP